MLIGNQKLYIKKLISVAVVFVISIIVAACLLGSDFGAFMQWWLVLLLLGIVFMPLCLVIFHCFHDGGWLFSKVIGLALSGWLMWYLSSIKLFRFTRVNCFIMVAVCLLLNLALYLYYKSRKHEKPLQLHEGVLSSALTAELIFFVFFLIWTYLRAFKPEAYGTEKFMDYGFMTTMMRAEYMPPEDLWLSGNSINYYYVGQYMATYLTKLSGVVVGKGYNLMLMTIAAMGFALPYSIAHNVMRVLIEEKKKDSFKRLRILPPITGVLAGVAVSLASTMHYPIYRFIIPGILKSPGLKASLDAVSYSFPSYWFPNATRYIGYFPETSDKTIHEFPSYSFVLGDLHAHVINIIFVLTVLGILFAWLLYRKQGMDEVRNGAAKVTYSFWKETFHPVILLLGFFIGLFHTTNYWDYPIYFVVAGAVILFSNIIFCRFSWRSLLLTGAQALTVILSAQLICLPFTLSFDQIPTSIKFTSNHTPLYQFAVLWGLPIMIVAVFLVVLIRKMKKKGWFKQEGKQKNIILQFFKGLRVSDLFILTIAFCAIGLTLLPELIYVKDIYTGEHTRANTMFKLTYQAYIMFGISMAYILVKLLMFAGSRFQRVFSAIALAFLLFTTGYMGNSIFAWFGDVFDTERYQGLDASAFMERESMDDYLATKWLNENVEGLPVVLEADGDSYTFYQRVSVITGLPTVSGWKTHEWLWRSDSSGDYPPILEKRNSDIKSIYTSNSLEKVKALLETYHVSYIYVGKLEEEKYDNQVNHELLRRLGEIVFEIPANDEKNYATYIMRVR